MINLNHKCIFSTHKSYSGYHQLTTATYFYKFITKGSHKRFYFMPAVGKNNVTCKARGVRMQTAMPMDRLAGTMLGDYQIERLLNHGKQGTAYIAKGRGQGQPVMVTIFALPETLPDHVRQIFWARFSQESQKLISSFMKGRSLAQIIKQQPRFTPQQTLLILKQVAVGLDYMHKNQVIHGSL